MADIIDARGRSCPEPVLLTKKALTGGAPQVTVLVDNAVAMENVSRYATKEGYEIALREIDDEYEMTLKRKA